MAITAGVAEVVIAAGATAYGVHEQRKAAEEAMAAAKPPELPKQPLGAEQSAAAQVARADLLSQSAGGTVLSEKRSGSAGMGTAVKPPATLLGTG
jgi:hypothetical protein